MQSVLSVGWSSANQVRVELSLGAQITVTVTGRRPSTSAAKQPFSSFLPVRIQTCPSIHPPVNVEPRIRNAAYLYSMPRYNTADLIMFRRAAAAGEFWWESND